MKLARVRLDVKNNQAPVERSEEVGVIRGLITDTLLTLRRGRLGDNQNDLSNIYVCGLPGFGKTLTIEHILRDMLDEQNARKSLAVDHASKAFTKVKGVSGQDENEALPEFVVVDISGPSVHLDNIYQVIAARLGMSSSDSYTAANERSAREMLLARFRNDRLCLGRGKTNGKAAEPITILMIDEIDRAPRRVVKELLEIMGHAAYPPRGYEGHPSHWPCSLIVIGIANDVRFRFNLEVTYSAEERIRVICFRPYVLSQLESILRNRSQGLLNARALYLLAARGLRSEKGECQILFSSYSFFLPFLFRQSSISFKSPSISSCKVTFV